MTSKSFAATSSRCGWRGKPSPPSPPMTDPSGTSSNRRLTARRPGTSAGRGTPGAATCELTALGAPGTGRTRGSGHAHAFIQRIGRPRPAREPLSDRPAACAAACVPAVRHTCQRAEPFCGKVCQRRVQAEGQAAPLAHKRDGVAVVGDGHGGAGCCGRQRRCRARCRRRRRGRHRRDRRRRRR